MGKLGCRDWRGFGLVACASVIALAGCGSGSDSNASDPAGPRAIAVAWSKAIDARDGGKACSLMTPASVKSVEKPLKPLIVPLPVGRTNQVRKKQLSAGHPARPCAKEMSHGLGPKLPAGSTSVKGDRAVVEMKEREGDSWSRRRDGRGGRSLLASEPDPGARCPAFGKCISLAQRATQLSARG
jgi:hypothetical protein